MIKRFKFAGWFAIATVFAALLALPTMGGAQGQSSSGPNFQETINFIRQTLASDSGVRYSGDSLAGPWSVTETDSVVGVSGCSVDLQFTRDTNAKYPQHTSLVYHINLSSIDPKSVQYTSERLTGFVSADKADYFFLSTTDNAKTIRSTSSTSESSAESSFVVPASSSTTLSRLLNAFVHAITLCGGKPSTF
jgi:hypothetical protein